ncbi:hypothetical protein EX30DRAFT_262975 [Ascodesmis nigricans]|uniref:Secreted protein n=1 Tax=Ascodesmis nigricans TaxID=341454 RepID=A0A4S2MXL4_9PEZI|nr:hypothetical protein EX30DRAFT_262975 [Ascodesmis nigricans]
MCPHILHLLCLALSRSLSPSCDYNTERVLTQKKTKNTHTTEKTNSKLRNPLQQDSTSNHTNNTNQASKGDSRQVGAGRALIIIAIRFGSLAGRKRRGDSGRQIRRRSSNSGAGNDLLSLEVLIPGALALGLLARVLLLELLPAVKGLVLVVDGGDLGRRGVSGRFNLVAGLLGSGFDVALQVGACGFASLVTILNVVDGARSSGGNGSACCSGG